MLTEENGILTYINKTYVYDFTTNFEENSLIVGFIENAGCFLVVQI